MDVTSLNVKLLEEASQLSNSRVARASTILSAQRDTKPVLPQAGSADVTYEEAEPANKCDWQVPCTANSTVPAASEASLAPGGVVAMVSGGEVRKNTNERIEADC